MLLPYDFPQKTLLDISMSDSARVFCRRISNTINVSEPFWYEHFAGRKKSFFERNINNTNDMYDGCVWNIEAKFKPSSPQKRLIDYTQARGKGVACGKQLEAQRLQLDVLPEICYISAPFDSIFDSYTKRFPLYNDWNGTSRKVGALPSSGFWVKLNH